MAMSKRHFEKLAAILRDEAQKLADAPTDTTEYLQGRRDGLNQIKQAVAFMCSDENPNFDRARFLAACEPSKE